MSTSTAPEPDEHIQKHESKVSRYFEDYASSHRRGTYYLVRHPFRSVSALTSLLRLPLLRAHLQGNTDGLAIRMGLSRESGFGSIPVIRSATDVLALPSTPEEYALGAPKQTLRRKVRSARKAGVRWAAVNDPDERQELLALANEHERLHPHAQYRQSHPDNRDLLDYELWLVAYAADNRPLLLSVTPVDGEWALLRYFRILGEGAEFSDSRYLMTKALAETLVKRGVRYLVNSETPFTLSKGLRHFQRMVGWRVMRVELAV